MNCPICGRWIPAGSPRCTACGADLADPDVRALVGAAGAAGAAPGAAPSAGASLAEGALANDRFLGMTGTGIASGASLRRLAAVGGALLLIGFALPIDLDFQGARFPLSVLGDGPRGALLVPLILGLAGIAVAIPRRGGIPAVVLAGLLAAGGLVELALGLTPLGRAASAASALPALTWLGALVAAVGVALRVLRPTDPWARWIVAGGAAVFVLGGLFPHDDAAPLLAWEYRTLAPRGAPLDGSVLGWAWEGVGSHALVQFLAMWQLAPVVLLPLAAALAFRRPTGLWDTSGNALRVAGLAIVGWIPLTFALGAFNVLGWPDGWVIHGDEGQVLRMSDFSRALLLGRIKLALLSAGAVLWVTGGAAALLALLRPRAARR